MHDSALNRYLDRVRALPRIDAEEERELAVRARAGDTRARRALIEANLACAATCALRHRRYGLRVAELLAEANLGLVMAATKFDPDRGVRFATYAQYWTRAFVLEHVARSSTLVGAGAGPLRTKLFFRLRRERARVASLHADSETRVALLAARFGVTEPRMREMLHRSDARDVSLDAPATDSERPPELVAQGALPDESAAEAQRSRWAHAAVHDALRVLDARERLILERRYFADAEVSLADLGRELGISRERARQLEARAMRKVRAWVQDHARQVA